MPAPPLMWCSLNGDPVDDILATVQSLVGARDRVLHVGTDSQVNARVTDFVTVICVLHPGHGGRVFYKRSRSRRGLHLATRLMHEAELSLEVARTFDPELARDIIVHVDANEDPRHRSSNYVQALAGMVVGNGFRVRLKPDSWCASHVADHVVRHREARAA